MMTETEAEMAQTTGALVVNLVTGTIGKIANVRNATLVTAAEVWWQLENGEAGWLWLDDVELLDSIPDVTED